MKTFYSNGKLLITGEYVVLDGALALALPTRLGQSLTVEPMGSQKIIWKSFDNQGTIWFECEFSFEEITSKPTQTGDAALKRLIQILKSAKQLNPGFLSSATGFKATSHLNFKKDWGLGTSSTLINNMAQWANVDAYKLLEMTFGGSGYDIACAQNNSPITYQLKEGIPYIDAVAFNPPFKEHLYFVYLNKKQDSREGIIQYQVNKTTSRNVINEINDITTRLITCQSLTDFETLIANHEKMISKVIKQKPVKEILFNDFRGSMKSLGAWGGDFILVASLENPQSYFKKKGFETVLPFNNLILNPSAK